MKCRVNFSNKFFITTIFFFFLSFDLSAKIRLGENKDTLFVSFRDIIKIGNSCTGYLFPGTPYVWTLNDCLDFDTINGEKVIRNPIISNNWHYLDSTSSISSDNKNDTFKFQRILYENIDWVIFQVSLPNDFQSEIHPILIDSTNTVSIGYPCETAYYSDQITNYMDWILYPRWIYQRDSFINSIYSLHIIKPVDLSVNKLKDLKNANKYYLVDVSKSDIDELNKRSLNKAITFCIQQWTDHLYARNRVATFSELENNPFIIEKKTAILKSENKQVETAGLAARLFMTLSLLPNSFIPEIVLELTLSFQKDYFRAAQFLMEHPDQLNQITLSIRNIKLLSIKEGADKLPVWNQQDTILAGNGSLQIVQNISENQFEDKRYWRVPGMSGAPVFKNGKLTGIQKNIPFYFARELNFLSEFKLVPVKELVDLKKQDKNLEIWEKINGLIQE